MQMKSENTNTLRPKKVTATEDKKEVRFKKREKEREMRDVSKRDDLNTSNMRRSEFSSLYVQTSCCLKRNSF